MLSHENVVHTTFFMCDPVCLILGGSNPQSMTSPLLMPVPGASGSGQPQADASGAAMAFTYVPVPGVNILLKIENYSKITKTGSKIFHRSISIFVESDL